MNYLKSKLEEKKITQAELARRLGVTRGYICDLVHGRNYLNKMPLDKLASIANILDIPIKDFFEGVLK